MPHGIVVMANWNVEQSEGARALAAFAGERVVADMLLSIAQWCARARTGNREFSIQYVAGATRESWRVVMRDHDTGTEYTILGASLPDTLHDVVVWTTLRDRRK
jgi:hypothetical protein